MRSEVYCIQIQSLVCSEVKTEEVHMGIANVANGYHITAKV